MGPEDVFGKTRFISMFPYRNKYFYHKSSFPSKLFNFALAKSFKMALISLKIGKKLELIEMTLNACKKPILRKWGHFKKTCPKFINNTSQF
jgi:hypothetical protein